MAFLDTPIVDKSSRNSEKSERRLRDFFNQESGFICRQEVPDKGCDFDVELILQNQNASSWKFPIQLKSVEKLTLVENNEFISYSFETSRLGYLMRRIPSMGIIVLYSVDQNQCYYEYADRIYSRLMQDRDSDEWKKNEKVSIHIPYSNALSEQTSIEIHETIKNRFGQAMTMQNSFGPKYGLPTIDIDQGPEYDFNNVEDVIKFLEAHGQSLISNYDVDMLFQMITRVPHIQIYRNKDLSLVAAVAYSESGHNSESEIFCNKLKKGSLTPDETLMIKFIVLKNELALGYINNTEFLFKLKKLSELDLSTKNRITLKINIIRSEMLNQKNLNEIPGEFLKSIDEVFEVIRKTEWNNRNKGLYMLWNCENLSSLANAVMISSLGDIQIRESLNEKIPLEERFKAVLKSLSLENRITEIISEIGKTARNDDDRLVTAYTCALDVQHFLLVQLNMIAFDVPVSIENKQRLQNKISNAGLAHNNFLNLHLYREAYFALCNLIELVELAEKVYFIAQPHSKTTLYHRKEEIEKDFEITPREIATTNLLTYNASKGNQRDMSYCKDLDDEQIEFFAKTVLKSMKLSPDRLMNIVAELSAYRTFYLRCIDNNIEVIQMPTGKDYSSRILFRLRDNQKRIQTEFSDNMDSLLKSWGF